MANPQHLELLRAGKMKWNNWKASTSEKVDLSNALLSNLFNKNNGQNLNFYDLKNVNLQNSNLTGVDLTNAYLDEADLASAILDGAIINSTSFRNAFLVGIKLRAIEANRAIFKGAILTDADLSNSKFYQSDFSEATLDNANFWEAAFIESIFKNTYFSKAKFYNTILANVDLSMAIRLEEIIHNNNTFIDMRTLQLSRMVLPEGFLLNCGFTKENIDTLNEIKINSSKQLSSKQLSPNLTIEDPSINLQSNSKDISTIKNLYTLKGAAHGAITQMGWSMNGNYFAAGFTEINSIYVWHCSTTELYCTLESNSIPTSLIWIKGGFTRNNTPNVSQYMWSQGDVTDLNKKGLIAAGYSDGILRIWNVASETIFNNKEFKNHSTPILKIIQNGKTDKVLSMSNDEIQSWRLCTDKTKPVLFAPGRNKALLAQDGKTFISSAEQDLWYSPKGTDVYKIGKHPAKITAISCSADFKEAAIGGADGSIRLWVLDNDGKYESLKGHNESIIHLEYLKNDRCIFSKSLDGNIKIWDRVTKEVIFSLSQPSNLYCVGFAVHPLDSSVIALLKDAHTIEVYKLNFDEEIGLNKNKNVIVVDQSKSNATIAALTNNVAELETEAIVKIQEVLPNGVEIKEALLKAKEENVNSSTSELTRLNSSNLTDNNIMKTSLDRLDENLSDSNSQWLFTWVHISDIHCGHGDVKELHDRKLIINELNSDIKKKINDYKIGKLDTILLTGDIAFSGNAVNDKEYDEAKKWLTGLSMGIGIKSEKIFIVPGNHDVQRAGKNDRNINRLLKSLREHDDKLDNAINDLGDNTSLFKKIK